MPRLWPRAKKSERISVCIPTLNEAASIGPIVHCVREQLMARVPLVDEILVIDSDSTDDTCASARRTGATVLRSAEIAAGTGTHSGKGENLWKALHAASGTILCFLDGDIANFHAGFVTGLLGPLPTRPDVGYVKAYCLYSVIWKIDSSGQNGGRVLRVLIRRRT